MTEENRVAEMLQNEEVLKAYADFFNNGGTLRMLQGLSPEAMESIYEIAYNQYQSGKYKNAEKMFQYLSLMDHYQQKYYIGLGGCRQMQKKYKHAIDSYTHAGILDLKNPVPPFQVAECQLALGNLAEAESGFFAAVQWAADKEEYSGLKQKAEQMLALLKSREDQSMDTDVV